MARTTAKERLARREHALALLADGNSFRTVAALMSGKYGVSEKTAQRDLAWARNRLVGELRPTEVKELLSWFCHSTQTIVKKARGRCIRGCCCWHESDLSGGTEQRAGHDEWQPKQIGLRQPAWQLQNLTLWRTNWRTLVEKCV